MRVTHRHARRLRPQMQDQTGRRRRNPVFAGREERGRREAAVCWFYGRACRQAAAGSSAGSCRQLQAADKRRGCGTRADGGVAFDRHALPNMGTRGGPRDPSAPASTMKPCAFMAGDQEVRSLQQCRIYVRNLCREWLSDLYRPQSFSLGSISSLVLFSPTPPYLRTSLSSPGRPRCFTAVWAQFSLLPREFAPSSLALDNMSRPSTEVFVVV